MTFAISVCPRATHVSCTVLSCINFETDHVGRNAIERRGKGEKGNENADSVPWKEYQGKRAIEINVEFP